MAIPMMEMAMCVTCSKPLTLYIRPDEEDEEDEPMEGSADANTGSYVDDDVQLQCGCHFHWECLLDSYSLSECPKCGRNLITTTPLGEEQLLCNLKNEGGLQEGFDLLPVFTEECYLKTYPEERKGRAFLDLCGEGDVKAIVDLLSDDGEENEEDSGQGVGHTIDVLRYQDQLGSMGSGLHIAAVGQHVEVAWLLLFLASTLKTDEFPVEILQAAQELGIQREDQSGKTDIRLLKDSGGMTAEQRAAETGGIWNEWLYRDLLKSPAN